MEPEDGSLVRLLSKSQKGAPRKRRSDARRSTNNIHHPPLATAAGPSLPPAATPSALARCMQVNSTAVDHHHDPITPSRRYPCGSRYFYTGEEIKKYIITYLRR